MVKYSIKDFIKKEVFALFSWDRCLQNNCSKFNLVQVSGTGVLLSLMCFPKGMSS